MNEIVKRLVFLLAIFSFLPFASAAPTVINDCNYNVTSGGLYQLDTNLNLTSLNTPGYCINLRVSNVVIDLNGKDINLSLTNTTGVFAGKGINGTLAFSNITIHTGRIVNGPTTPALGTPVAGTFVGTSAIYFRNVTFKLENVPSGTVVLNFTNTTGVQINGSWFNITPGSTTYQLVLVNGGTAMVRTTNMSAISVNAVAFNLTGNSDGSYVNSTRNLSQIIVSTDSTFLNYWYFTVQAVDRNSVPVVGAYVFARAPNGTEYTVYSGSGGYSNFTLITYIVDGATSTNVTPYYVHAGYNGQGANSNLSVDSSFTFQMALGSAPAFIDQSEGVGTTVLTAIKGVLQGFAQVVDKTLDPSFGVVEIIVVGIALLVIGFVIVRAIVVRRQAKRLM